MGYTHIPGFEAAKLLALGLPVYARPVRSRHYFPINPHHSIYVLSMCGYKFFMNSGDHWRVRSAFVEVPTGNINTKFPFQWARA